ncbi:flagellar brake protein [Massilia sp. IC2-477]|uniref:flagellar brake protein n=1 Tax=Massilia sp. IC2-477 TaxID=2887198 RepID=UPI001D13078C|nr:flagellar brake protein [Massilia sp. IC2-477]MCC2956925.1 flagellar brake protein [Massilia sp. IC2-477]
MTTDPARELKPQEFEFETMNLQVGVRLQVMTHRHLKPVQYFSTLIGYVKDEYLIIKIPTENGAPIAMTEGEPLTIRVFSGVNVCSFACSVERVFARPLNYVHLSFPTAIQGTSLRGAMRVKAEIAAHATREGSGAAPVACTLTNVSVTGARIESGYPLPGDSDSVKLAFTLVIPPTNEERPVETVAAIRNMTVARPAPDKPDVYSYGVQFVDLDPVHYTLLQNMTYEALLADRLKIV